MAKTASKPRAPSLPDRAKASRLLEQYWELVLNDDDLASTPEINAVINSDLVAVRYCLPTQLLGKLTDPSLDALCLQEKASPPGNRDPRSFSAAVVAPWVIRNQKVLGSSAEPYVGNPLRRPRLNEGLDQLRDPERWTGLTAILEDVQGRDDPAYTERVFTQTLAAIRDRMREHAFVYVVPPRVSLLQADGLIRKFLSEKSGGDRGLAVAAALFGAFRERLRLYKEIRRGSINASDASTGAAADLECVGMDGDVVLAVEVKERRIGDNDVVVAVNKARTQNVREIILCTEGIAEADQKAVDDTFARAWASGTSLYHATIAELMRGALPLLGEQGVREFVVQIGQQLDAFSTQPRHRRAWKALLDAL